MRGGAGEEGDRAFCFVFSFEGGFDVVEFESKRRRGGRR